MRKTFLSPKGETIEVIRGISFSAVAGETMAIMGASGAGKSTLLHLLGGLESADEGTIELDQFDIGAARPSELARFHNSQVGFVFQFHYLLPDLTAVENVALPLMIARLSHNKSMHQAAQALNRIGLGDRLQHKIGHLSGGEQQRVAVARALISKPNLVLADEPTGNLDAAVSDDIGRALATYSRERRAIVVVATHNERLARWCDRVFLLRDGTTHQC